MGRKEVRKELTKRKHHIVYSGICEKSFFEGYDSITGFFDKRGVQSPVKYPDGFFWFYGPKNELNWINKKIYYICNSILKMGRKINAASTNAIHIFDYWNKRINLYNEIDDEKCLIKKINSPGEPLVASAIIPGDYQDNRVKGPVFIDRLFKIEINSPLNLAEGYPNYNIKNISYRL